MLSHTLSTHNKDQQFSARKVVLDECTGRSAYRSIHYNVSIQEIKRRIEQGTTPVFGSENKIRFKRKEPEVNINTTVTTQDSQTSTDNCELSELIHDVIHVMNEHNRKEDFIHTLHAIRKGHLLQNVAFHLLLDIGLFYSQSSISNMRYSEQSLSFWMTVQKLFKSRGINFFRGYKADGIARADRITPQQCKINFIVPSDRVLQRESAVYKMDSSKPGLLSIPLDEFSNNHQGQDVKLSVDGKKIAVGYGDLGEEDLGGLEQPPTLSERKDRLASETATLKEIKITLGTENTESMNRLEDDVKEALRRLLLKSITNMSTRIKEIRELSVRKKIQLDNLKKKVEGNWTDSKFAPSISFLHTKLAECKTSITDLLASIDKLAYICACLNGTSNSYILGSQVTIDLGQQRNYMCLREITEDHQDPHFTKQRTERWFQLREKASITGSTLFRALGLETLKRQQEHFDRVKFGMNQPVSATVQSYMDHGAKNEVNALATLLGKIMPVFHPEFVFREDGCEVMKMNKGGYMVISGDGSAFHQQSSRIAFEMKCTVEGKVRTTDVHYSIPKYYTTQVLSQMAAKQCEEFGYICFTSESTTYIKGKMNKMLWAEIWNVANALYAEDSPRPTHKHAAVSKLLEELKVFASEATFVAEFPSLYGLPCGCAPVATVEDAYKVHSLPDSSEHVAKSSCLDSSCIDIATGALQSAYNVLRRPAKEVLVTVMSDLDRTLHSSSHTHAVPIQYGLCGFSFKMETARKYLEQAVKACLDRQLMVKVIAFDGQFSEIAVYDENKRPLTILQFMKCYWQKVQKLSREVKVNALLEGGLVCPSPDNIRKVSETKKSLTLQSELDQEDAEIDSVLPAADNDNDSRLDDTGPHASTDASQDNTSNLNHSADPNDTRPEGNLECNFEQILLALIAADPQRESKWKSCSLDHFRRCFTTALDIKKSFTVKELKLVISTIGVKHDAKMSKAVKADFVNIISKYLGNASRVDRKTPLKNPRSLKQITTRHIRSWRIAAVNVAYAQIHFEQEFRKWDKNNLFSGPWIIESEDGSSTTINQWYAQPSNVLDHTMQMVIDPHHLFVNSRCKCCSSGMPSMGIYPSAWWKVASECKANDTRLSLEIAKELRDRQSNSFAQRTFSASVEHEMRNNGDSAAAEWCRLLRNWYSSVDTAGISVDQRLTWMMDMRNYLLKFLHIGEFPPPTQYIADMPVVQYEGFLCNIDRRLQLYSMVQDGTYNHRALSTLDSENFFAAFQVNSFRIDYLCKRI